MKRLLTLILSCLAPIAITMAQNLEVVDFRLLETDLTANTHGTLKVDQNGETAALIKIQTPERGFTFDGGSLGIVATEEHDGEIWLYVPRRAMKLTIQHKDYGVMRDYVYPVTIQGGRAYEMFIDIGIGRYVTITSQIARSTIYIDGENVGEAPVHNHYLNYGTHIIRAQKDRFEGEQRVMITTGDNQHRLISIDQRDISDLFGNVTVTVDNRADIFFEGKNVGTGQWSTQLREGNYVVETRKADCDPVKTSFTVVAQRQNDVKANTPVPHTGWLNVYTRPHDVSSVYNNTHPIDLSETITLPVGTYQFEFTRRGYYPLKREFKVRHNETTRDTVTLERVKYVKPLAFYFGGGYTVRTLSGLTAVVGAVVKGHDLQAFYTFGLTSSDPISSYDAEGNHDYLSTATFKQSSFGLKYGYQFHLMEQVAIVPQVGIAIDRLSGTVEEGTTLYGDGASATCLSIGAKLLYAPIQHFYLFAAPEFNIALKKDDNFQRLSDASNIPLGGFAATVGLIVNF